MEYRPKDYENMTKLEEEYIDYIKQNPNISAEELVDRMTMRCDRSLLYCVWRGEPFDCCENVKVMRGWYTFHCWMLPIADYINQSLYGGTSKTLTLRHFYLKRQHYLQCKALSYMICKDKQALLFGKV